MNSQLGAPVEAKPIFNDLDVKVLKSRFTIHSADPDKLAKFYTEVLGFKQLLHVDREGEYGYGIEAAPGYKIWIAKHSDITGKHKDPFRVLITFYVDDLREYFEQVRNFDQKLIVESPQEYCMEIPGEERIVCAFYDVDGNCVQLMQKY